MSFEGILEMYGGKEILGKNLQDMMLHVTLSL